MTKWPQLPIRRVFRVVNGGTPTSDAANWDGEVPWATPVDLGRVNGGLLTSTDRTLTEAGLLSGSRVVPSGALVVSTRAPIGYVAEAGVDLAFNQGCRGLVPVTSTDSRYFRYQLSVMTSRLGSHGQGSTFVELSSEGLASSLVVCPPLAMQRAIADFLDTETARIDALITKKRQMIELLQQRQTAVSIRWFEALDAEHGRVQLRRIITRMEQGWSPICDSEPADAGEWAVLKTSSVSSGVFKPDKNKRLPEETEPDLR